MFSSFLIGNEIIITKISHSSDSSEIVIAFFQT